MRSRLRCAFQHLVLHLWHFGVICVMSCLMYYIRINHGDLLRPSLGDPPSANTSLGLLLLTQPQMNYRPIDVVRIHTSRHVISTNLDFPLSERNPPLSNQDWLRSNPQTSRFLPCEVGEQPLFPRLPRQATGGPLREGLEGARDTAGCSLYMLPPKASPCYYLMARVRGLAVRRAFVYCTCCSCV